MPFKERTVERIVGPCSKHVSGEGWVTEVPVSAILGRGYVREKIADLEERKDNNFDKVWQCTHCDRYYINVDRATLEKMYKYCPNCGAKFINYLTLKAQKIRDKEADKQ